MRQENHDATRVWWGHDKSATNLVELKKINAGVRQENHDATRIWW